LETFRKLAHQLIRPTGSTLNRDRRIQAVINSIRRVFETEMDNDLNVGSAFDGMLKLFLELKENKNRMVSRDARDIAKVLKKIDSVLGVIF
jgi:cysteinyl-tRNA synthetase